MFQKSSGNAQARTERKATFSRANEHGIDPTAFKETDVGSYDALVEKKRKLELQIADIKARISKAASNKYASGKLVDRTIWNRWQADLVDCKKRIVEVEAELQKARAQRRAQQARGDELHRGSFEFHFAQLAKELLAEPVYNRVATAALHRMKADGAA
jgi:hypothetical protein